MTTAVGVDAPVETESLGRKLLSSAAFPAVMIVFVGAGIFGIPRGYPVPVTVMVLSALSVPVVIFLERIHPYTPAWKPKASDMRVDALHLLISQLAPGEVYNALSRSALLWWALQISH